MFPNYCIACGQRHIPNIENQVTVYDRDGLGLVVYEKGCDELAKSMTVAGLIARGYTHEDVAYRIVEGIAKGFGPKTIVKGGK